MVFFKYVGLTAANPTLEYVAQPICVTLLVVSLVPPVCSMFRGRASYTNINIHSSLQGDDTNDFIILINSASCYKETCRIMWSVLIFSVMCSWSIASPRTTHGTSNIDIPKDFFFFVDTTRVFGLKNSTIRDNLRRVRILCVKFFYLVLEIISVNISLIKNRMIKLCIPYSCIVNFWILLRLGVFVQAVAAPDDECLKTGR